MAQIKINELPQQANTSNVSVLGVTDNGNGVLLPIEEAIATKEELATIGSYVGYNASQQLNKDLTNTTLISSKGIRGTTGAIDNYSSAVKSTDYINIEGYSTIEFQGAKHYQSGQTCGYAFYSEIPATDDDAPSCYVRGSAFTIDTTLSGREKKVYTVSVPSGAKYFRTTIYVSVNTDWYFKAMQESGASLPTQLSAMQSSINTKANASDVSTMQSTLQTAINTKANASDVSSMQTNLQNAINAKPSQDDLSDVSDKVGNVPFTELKKTIANTTWESGGVSGTLGTNMSTSAAIQRTKDYISVEGFSQISLLAVKNNVKGQTYGYAFYSDEDLTTFVSGGVYTIDTTLAERTEYTYIINVPSTAKYIRCTRFVSANPNWSVKAKIGDSLQTQLTNLKAKVEGTSPLKKGVLLTNKIDYASYYKCQETEFSEGFSLWGGGATKGGTPSYAQLIAKYDALMATDTAYMKKTNLGQASGTDDNENPYYLYKYTLTPRNIDDAGVTKIRPIIVIDACIHGHERNGAFGLYYLIKDIILNSDKDSILYHLRNEVEFHIIPVLNPWGFDNSQYVNGNRININRNFPCEGWTVVTSPEDQSSGAEPLDQPEAQMLSTLLTSLKDKVFFYINMHQNGARTAVQSYAESNPHMVLSGVTDEYYCKMNNAIKKHILMQTVEIPKRFPSITPSYTEKIGRFQDSSHVGIVTMYTVKTLNILSSNLEIAGNIKNAEGTTVTNNKQMQAIGAEMIGNWIAQMLCEYSE